MTQTTPDTETEPKVLHVAGADGCAAAGPDTAETKPGMVAGQGADQDPGLRHVLRFGTGGGPGADAPTDFAARIRAALKAELAALDGPEGAEGAQAGAGRPVRVETLRARARWAALDLRRRGRRAQLAAALHRLDTCAFGRCAACGTPLDPAALLRDPTETHCPSCRP